MRATTIRITATSLLVCLVLIGATRAPAQAPDTVFLEDLTSTEVRDLVRAGTTTMIVPVGGTEQNGPHMALGKHNVRARVLAERVARGVGRALVAPVIAYVPEGAIDPPTGHMRFAGTLSVPDDVFQRVLEAAARSVVAHGFLDVVFLGDHGSTQAGQRAVAARLNREWKGARARAHAVDAYYRASDVELKEILVARGFRADELGTHAGLTDTALMLAVDPRLVRVDRLRPGGAGVAGDPTRATAEIGRVGTDLIVARTVDAIRKAIASR